MKSLELKELESVSEQDVGQAQKFPSQQERDEAALARYGKKQQLEVRDYL